MWFKDQKRWITWVILFLNPDENDHFLIETWLEVKLKGLKDEDTELKNIGDWRGFEREDNLTWIRDDKTDFTSQLMSGAELCIK